MSSRSFRELRQLNNRKDGLMKKACDLRRLCSGVRIAIIIEYDGKVDAFRTEDGFLSTLQIQSANELRPKDYITAREAEEASLRERQGTSSELEFFEENLFGPDSYPNLDLDSSYKAGSSPPFAEQESISAETLPQAPGNDVDGGLLGLRDEQASMWQLAKMLRHNNKATNPGRIQKGSDQTLKRRMTARQAMSGGKEGY
ncbi:hypothetical protein V491_02896 [Pseudogymnoascus sp. VKM F-3775]|nr:hypothetical protein V491_02896 [Pseudogymnoascus sp. VKM F-3775]